MPSVPSRRQGSPSPELFERGSEPCATQAALSHQIRNLETRLEFSLFRRVPRALVLTEGYSRHRIPKGRATPLLRYKAPAGGDALSYRRLTHGWAPQEPLYDRMKNAVINESAECVIIPSLETELRVWRKENRATLEKTKFIIGCGYDSAQLAESRHPTRAELDEIDGVSDSTDPSIMTV